MKKARHPATKTFPVSPQVTLEFKVVLHRTLKSLIDAHNAFLKRRDEYVLAFWKSNGNSSPALGELHLCRQYSTHSIISHECFHASLSLGRRLYLNLENRDAEELLAEAAEAMLRETTKFVRDAKRR